MLIKIPRNSFEELIAPSVQKSFEIVSQVFEYAEIKYSDIDGVLLVGGSTRIGYIQRLIQENLGKPPILLSDESIAIGAAVQAAQLEIVSAEEGIPTAEEKEMSIPETAQKPPVPEESHTRGTIEEKEREEQTPTISPEVSEGKAPVTESTSHEIYGEMPPSGKDPEDEPILERPKLTVIFRYAKELINKKSYDRAEGFLQGLITEAETLLSTIPNRPNPDAQKYLQKAYRSLEDGNYQEAVNISHQAYSIDADNPATFDSMLDIHLKAAMKDTSIEGYERSITLLICAQRHDQTNPEIYKLLANRHFLHAQQLHQIGDNQGALKALNACFQFDPDNEEATKLYDDIEKVEAQKS